jgi:hypothetical protein
MYLSSNLTFHARTKHIEVDFHFVCERGWSKVISNMLHLLQGPVSRYVRQAYPSTIVYCS